MMPTENDDELAARFMPDYTPEQLENLGVYDSLYRGQGPRLASLGEWKPEWISEHDPKGWAQWYKRYAAGRRIPEEDERQMKRWLSFKARHGGPFAKNPTPRRGWALRNWGIDPTKLVEPQQSPQIQEMLDTYKNRKMQRYVKEKQAELLPEVNLQPHQERIQETVNEDSPRMIVYHGLGSGKSLSALAAAEAAKQKYNEDYGIVAPASLKGNFQKEVEKFTRDSNPEILSYTGLGLGKKFSKPPETVIMDEAHRLRNPGGAAAQAAADVANQAKRVLLLTGSPITNSPSDLANLISIVARKNISPQEFEKKYIGYRTVHPGLINWARGIKPGVQPVVKNESELRKLLEGHVDYQPSKTPEGVNVNEEKIEVPLTQQQQKIQQALRTKIPPSFLWKLDQEFPLSKDELSKLNSFLTGLRQNSVSTRPFRVDNDAFRAFQQSGKLQEAYKRLQELLASDPRKKAIIYSNHIGAGVEPYAAALAKYNIPHGIFHGGIPTKQRQKALADYNAGKLRALLIGPAGAEGLSTKGTNLIQLLDPHWHESRTQQARGRGLRFDSHDDLPEELKNVHVQRFISKSEDPSFLGKMLGYRRERTGDEILERLSNEKERINERFRELLREIGSQKHKSAAFEFGVKHAATACSCGCGDTTTTCKCGPDCSCRKPGGSCYKVEKAAGSPAWQRSEGKNEEGGLNAKGRASYNKATGGHLKAPVTESNPSGDRAKRQHSFCSRMCGMKRHETGSKTKKDPDSRINKSLRKWNCKCGSAEFETTADLSAAQLFGEKLASEVTWSDFLPELAQSFNPWNGRPEGAGHLDILKRWYAGGPRNEPADWTERAMQIGGPAIGIPAAIAAAPVIAPAVGAGGLTTAATAGTAAAAPTLAGRGIGLLKQLGSGALWGTGMSAAGDMYEKATASPPAASPPAASPPAAVDTEKLIEALNAANTQLAAPAPAPPAAPEPSPSILTPKNVALGALAVGAPIAGYYAYKNWVNRKKKQEKDASFRWYKRMPINDNLALNMSFGGPSLTVKKIIPGTSMTFGNRAPRLYVSTPIPGVAYQQYLSPKKHKIKAEKEFKDDPNTDDQRTTFEKIKDFLFGSEYKIDD
jgi:hypothetical protein